MTSPTPPASCPSCSDTPLAIATSAISFLTFLYALTVGLIYYYGLAKSNPKEVQKSIRLLRNSLGELQSMVKEVELTFSREPDAPLVEGEYHEQGKGDILVALQRLFQKTLALGALSNKINLQNPNSSRVAYWFQLVRLRYLIIREEVQQKLAEKDQLMTELRHIQQRIMKMKDKRAEKAFWKIHHEMLKLVRTEGLKDAESQALFHQHQEHMQLQQLQMLESISRRISTLEASASTATRGETTNSNPPAESTD